MSAAVDTMAWSGEPPWHWLGKNVHHDLTPRQMLCEADLDWTVEKIPMYGEINGKRIKANHCMLVRSTDLKVIDEVTANWIPNQNIDAFEFFNDFVMAGDMQMHTAGSLNGGKIVWALAKVNDSFTIFGGDKVEAHLLFVNPHQFGKSIDIRFTPIRVVCMNTLNLALATSVKNMVRISHRREFDPERAKEMLGIAHNKLEEYKEVAEFLGSKNFSSLNIIEYFKKVFPLNTSKAESTQMSKSAETAMSVLENQPGMEFAPGTFWQAFNTTTFMVDHMLGRTPDIRLGSAWFGQGNKIKNDALTLAIEMAEAA